MDFVERIRGKLGISKYEFAHRMGISPQGYHSLTNSTESLSLKAIIGLRKASGLSDRALLDEVEKEWNSRQKEALETHMASSRRKRG